MIQVPAKETRQEEQRRIRGYNVAKIYYTGRVHREIPVKTIRPFVSFLFFSFFLSRTFFAVIESRPDHESNFFSFTFFRLESFEYLSEHIPQQVRHAFLTHEARIHPIYHKSPLRHNEAKNEV